MALYIGNPTNVVVAQAYSIGFLEYSAWMMLPTVICIVLAYITMRIMFRKDKYIPEVISSPYEEPRSALNDPAGAVFGSVVLGGCLATLIGTSFAGVEVWMVTLPFSVVMLARDLWYDLRGPKRLRNEKTNVDDINALQSDAAPSHLVDSYSIPLEHVELDSASGRMTNGSSPTLYLGTTELESNASTMAGGSQSAQKSQKNTFSKEADTPRRGLDRFPTIVGVMKRMPWKILPFSVGMFTLVEALSSLGWTALFATALVQITPNYIAAAFAVTFITSILCQFLNNLPMTILFIRVIQHPNFYQAASVTPVVVKAVIFSLVIGSNLGACLTLVGSLAGIM
jgi:Na+/H+ antiporter NhaD/arsenite permease-like protein